MAERITVDHEALRLAGNAVYAMAGALESRRGALTGVLVEVEGQLAGAACVGALRGLSEAVDDVNGDLVTALSGFARGLETVVDRFIEVDVVSAASARAAW